MTKELTNQCALFIIDPENKEAPDLDYTQAIPANLTPAKLIEIYNKLWALQTNAGLQMKKGTPKPEKLMIDAELENQFESHRIQAYEQAIGTTLTEKSEAKLNMVRAYLTFSSAA